MIDDEVLYVHSQLYPWGDDRRRWYLHLYYNAEMRAHAIDRFNRELIAYKEELESGKPRAEHKEQYETFFIITTTPVRGMKVSYNNEAVSHYIKRYAGFQAILTTKFKDPCEALQVYRDKDIIEKCFDDLKNSLDMKRLRMHTIETVDGRLFVQFIALILISALRREMRTSKLIEKYTVRELLLEMDPLTKIRYAGKYGQILTEITKPQREILEQLNIQLPVVA
jgi:transposase